MTSLVVERSLIPKAPRGLVISPFLLTAVQRAMVGSVEIVPSLKRDPSTRSLPQLLHVIGTKRFWKLVKKELFPL